MGQREAGSCREAQEMINVFQVKENGNVAEMLDVWKHILRSKKYKNHKGVKERGKETELWIDLPGVLQTGALADKTAEEMQPTSGRRAGTCLLNFFLHHLDTLKAKKVTPFSR